MSPEADHVEMPISMESQFLGEVESVSDNFWSVDLCVNNNPASFKFASGAKVTVISEATPWLKNTTLQPATKEFRGPEDVSLSHLICGQLNLAQLKAGDASVTETVYVMRGQKHNLLSKTAIQSLKLKLHHLLFTQLKQHRTSNKSFLSSLVDWES